MTHAHRALPAYAVVVPTVGRQSLHTLLESLAAQEGPAPAEVVVVDDRRTAPGADDVSDLSAVVPAGLAGVRVLRGFGRGPAAARNLGWRVVEAPWVAFLDDDVELPLDWSTRLAADLGEAEPDVGAVQGRLRVPLPPDRKPTDWERSTAGLQDARWATADMAYRREALLGVHGFDERFPRAYREDADLALRVRGAGWRLTTGSRLVTHAVRAEDPRVSVRVQRGNADDALMRRLHGPGWRHAAEAGRGRLPWHVATVAAAATAAAAGTVAVAGRGRPAGGRAGALAAGAAASTVALWADFAWRRIAPGPRTRAEVSTMLWTSAVIPFAAVRHRVGGWWRHRGAAPWPPAARAVLFDRDGTLVHDVPYNGDPDRVEPVASATYAVRTLRRHGIRIGVVTNQSGVARGLLRPEDVAAVNRRVDRLLGPFDTWQVCPHGPDEQCACRKPAPGMVQAAAGRLGVRPEECVVIGDIGSDVLAARAAGARSVLVPTGATRPEEVRDAPEVATDLREAVDRLLGVDRA
ncbi:HAD-IIIA family hydrolase [Phycicoccus sp. M110.8]|uniref:HAD-IIIA family hydrolase n=1 Tax=Phycicoccus sp. M110.8 TaxID=3075433 RepID=UPI0028FD95ED|nr:HAD-IIIA family hydrolase [Phycicoccus sp. M110.8]MDU0315382.1 HAD-IIIA family hydrolase [Phycicoccus sp. M110.8]